MEITTRPGLIEGQGTWSNESSQCSSPEPSRELESVKNLLQTGLKRMQEKAAGYLASLNTDSTSALFYSQEKSLDEVTWNSHQTDGLEILGRTLIKTEGVGIFGFR